MTKYILKRIGLMLMTLFIISTICFVLVKLLPNPIVSPPGSDKYFIEKAHREAWGYDKPIITQYGIFLKNVLTKWDWGIGFKMYSMQSVTEVFLEKMPITVLVNLYAFFFSVPLGILFGIYAALKKNRWQDHFISVGVMIFVSVPSYVYAFLVQYFLCVKLNLFPLDVNAGFDYFSWPFFKSMIPAILSLSFGTIAGLTRFTRAELTECLTNESMLLARTKGLTRAQATRRHALRNAMVPILPMIIGEFIAILSGSFIIEQIFSIPGIGKLYITSINMRDYNFFMALSVFYTFIGLSAGILVDISYGFIDPRIRMGGKK